MHHLSVLHAHADPVLRVPLGPLAQPDNPHTDGKEHASRHRAVVDRVSALVQDIRDGDRLELPAEGVSEGTRHGEGRVDLRITLQARQVQAWVVR